MSWLIYDFYMINIQSILGLFFVWKESCETKFQEIKLELDSSESETFLDRLEASYFCKKFSVKSRSRSRVFSNLICALKPQSSLPSDLKVVDVQVDVCKSNSSCVLDFKHQQRGVVDQRFRAHIECNKMLTQNINKTLSHKEQNNSITKNLEHSKWVMKIGRKIWRNKEVKLIKKHGLKKTKKNFNGIRRARNQIFLFMTLVLSYKLATSKRNCQSRFRKKRTSEKYCRFRAGPTPMFDLKKLDHLNRINVSFFLLVLAHKRCQNLQERRWHCNKFNSKKKNGSRLLLHEYESKSASIARNKQTSIIKNQGLSEVEVGCFDLNDLGLKVRFIWQEVCVYPVYQQKANFNSAHGELGHHCMNYELFRLCSFSYTRFPPNFAIWVTHLAQAGFYFDNSNGRIICFYCNQEFHGPMDSPMEHVHLPGCQYFEHNKPLHTWTVGLSRVELNTFHMRYGNLRTSTFDPSNNELTFEASSNNNESNSRTSSLVPVGSISGSSTETTVSVVTLAGENLQSEDNNQVAYSVAPLIPAQNTARIRGLLSSLTQSLLSDHNDLSSSLVSHNNLSRALVSQDDLSRTLVSLDDLSMSLANQNNLPRVLVSQDDLSRALVSQESRDPAGAHQVLTSAAADPMPFFSTTYRDSLSQQVAGVSNIGGVGVAEPELDISKASYPLYSSLATRIQTFGPWQPTHSHRPENLAQAGFFYAGYADCVRCFYCGLGLKYWRATDIPANEHARFRPQCAFNRLYRGQDYINSGQEEQQTPQALGEFSTSTAPDEPSTSPVASETTAMSASSQVPGSEQDVTSVAVEEAQHLMNTAAALEALQDGWQRSQVLEALEQIDREMGEDCLEPDILLDVLRELNPEDLQANETSQDSMDSFHTGLSGESWSQHSSLDLPYVRASNQSDNVFGVENADAATEQTLTSSAHQLFEVSSAQINNADLFASVEREQVILAERTLCRICRNSQVSCIFLPCGHVIACQQCADISTHCTLCSKQIIGTANVYLA